MSLVEKLEGAITALQALRDEVAAAANDETKPELAGTRVHLADVQDSGAPERAGEALNAAAAGNAAAAPSSLEGSDAEQVRTALEGHDNELPFKCPACGKTFAEQVACGNGHQPEPTLPTDEVLAGATPQAAQEVGAARTPAEGQAQPSDPPAAPTGQGPSGGAGSSGSSSDPSWPS